MQTFRKFTMGSLCLDGAVQIIGLTQENVPIATILSCGDPAEITIEERLNQPNSRKISWIKPRGRNIFLADQTILSNVSWLTLFQQGYITGREITLNEHHFLCRVPTVDTKAERRSEFDDCLDIVGEDNEIWHWKGSEFWGQEHLGEPETSSHYTTAIIRGNTSPQAFTLGNITGRNGFCGFRPLLEPLPPAGVLPGKTVSLGGQKFHAAQYLPSSPSVFSPVLYPAQTGVDCQNDYIDDNVLGFDRNGTQIKAYTLLMSGKPVRQDLEEPVKYKAGTDIMFTDKYFGEQYLIPWNIHFGAAYCAKNLLRGITPADLIRMRYITVNKKNNS